MKTHDLPELNYNRTEATDEFIAKNKFVLRSEEEIKAKINKNSDEPMMFDFRNEVLVPYLSYEMARELLTEEGQKKYDEDKSAWIKNDSLKDCVQDFLDYMTFAWGKAVDQRSLSASRSIQKLGSWLWLLNREDLEELINKDELYNPYGAPALIAVCEQLGVEVPKEVIEFSKVKCKEGE